MRVYVAIATIVAVLPSAVVADTFGLGENEFVIDFVPIAGDAGDLGSWPAGNGYTFTGVDRDNYRMGKFEITNDQWDKFKASLGVPVTGDPLYAYDEDPYWTGANVPTNEVSWYEAAQFVNWLNTSTGHQAAYKFTGTQGTGDYAMGVWSHAEADNGTNLYRHKDAKYYMSTEDEWVKAAYWNGLGLQAYATRPGDALHQGDGTNGTGWNYYYGGYATYPRGPWNVGSGSEELNGTFDMMGNVWELMEGSWIDGDYETGSLRGLRSGAYNTPDSSYIASYGRGHQYAAYETYPVGFRVASNIPEPSSLALLSIGGIILSRRRR